MHRTFIRDQALALFTQISFAKTSVSDIAKACGLGKGTIYLYFKSKDDIVLAIIEDRIAHIEENDASFFGDPSVSLHDKILRFFEEVIDESFSLKDLIFGRFENVEGRMFKDIFFKYGRFYEWSIDRFAGIVRAYHPFSDRPEERFREDATVFINFMVGRMLLFLVGRDWNDKEGLKAIIRPLSLRLFDSLIAAPPIASK
jgi:AcrR family transcriptional regulator